MAIAPSNTTGAHALLLINPHTSFFFRSELQMVSDEGLNAYGASTWGQFFIYQGFNDTAGWMHTSSAVDDTDEYLETVDEEGRQATSTSTATKSGRSTSTTITVPYKTDSRHGARRSSPSTARITVRSSARPNGKWVSVRADAGAGEGADAVVHAHQGEATTSRSGRSMELHTNSSNNTIFADADGNIAYFHGNFIPKRDPSFDWTRPVDGSDPATDWQGLLSVDETPNLLNPASGWLYNTNNWPWSAAGPEQPEAGGLSRRTSTTAASRARGLHAIRVLAEQEGLHARLAARGRVRQLPDVVREADAGAPQGVGRGAGRPIR